MYSISKSLYREVGINLYHNYVAKVFAQLVFIKTRYKLKTSSTDVNITGIGAVPSAIGMMERTKSIFNVSVPTNIRSLDYEGFIRSSIDDIALILLLENDWIVHREQDEGMKSTAIKLLQEKKNKEFCKTFLNNYNDYNRIFNKQYNKDTLKWLSFYFGPHALCQLYLNEISRNRDSLRGLWEEILNNIYLGIPINQQDWLKYRGITIMVSDKKQAKKHLSLNLSNENNLAKFWTVEENDRKIESSTDIRGNKIIFKNDNVSAESLVPGEFDYSIHKDTRGNYYMNDRFVKLDYRTIYLWLNKDGIKPNYLNSNDKKTISSMPFDYGLTYSQFHTTSDFLETQKNVSIITDFLNN